MSKFQAILSGGGFSPWEFVTSLMLVAVMVDIASLKADEQADLDLASVELTIGPGVKNPPVVSEGALKVKSTRPVTATTHKMYLNYR